MRHPFYKGVLLGSLVAVVVLMAATALAGTGVGAVFHLGKVNTVDRTSYLSGTNSKKMLQVTNKGSGVALALKVKAGRPPLAVSSTAGVRRLNADMVDGLHARDMQTVLTARNDFTVSSQAERLTLPGLGRLDCSSPAEAVFTVRFQSTSDEVVHFAWGRYLWDVPQGGNISRTDAAPLVDDCLESRFIIWNSKRLATVLGVAAVTPGETEVTVVFQAVVQ